MTEEEGKIFQAHYEQAWGALKKVIGEQLAHRPVTPATMAAGEEADKHFAKCLEIAPSSWQCMWGKGKARQILGEHESALDCFRKACEIEPNNTDIWREASIEALAVGLVGEAIAASRRAIAIGGANPGLLANLALALLVGEQDVEAQAVAKSAIAADPNNEIVRNVLRLVTEVQRGRMKRPRKIRR